MTTDPEMWCPICGQTVEHRLRSLICCPNCNDLHGKLMHYVLQLPAREDELRSYLTAASLDEIAQLSDDERHSLLLFRTEMHRLAHAIELALLGEIGAREARHEPPYLLSLTRRADPFDDLNEWADAPMMWVALPEPDSTANDPRRAE